MPDKIQATRILCDGGLNTSENFLLLSQQSPGSAVRLINYEPASSGGYRRLNGYIHIDDTYHTVTAAGGDAAEDKILGIWGFLNSSNGDFEIYAARKLVSGDEYKIYLYDVLTGWSAVNTGTTQSSIGVNRIRTETFATELGNYIAIVDGTNKALIFDGTDWHQLDNANSGGALSPGGDQCLNAPAVVTYFKGHLFLSGDLSAPAVVAFCAPNDFLTWTAAAGAGQMLPGFDIVQLKAFRDECYIFGIASIRKAIPDEASGFVLQDVTNNLGCIARDSVIEVNSNIVFFGPDGLRTVAGTARIGDVELGPFSQQIHNTITDIINNRDLTELNALVIRGKTQFRYYISDSVTGVTDSYGLLCGLRHSSGLWEFAELNGFKFNCNWSGYNHLGQEVYLSGGYDGKVYLQEEDNTLNGTDMTSVYTTPFLDLGDTTVRKLFRTADIFVRAEGSVSSSLEVTYDWNRTTTPNPNAYPFDTIVGTPLFDAGFLFDDGNLFGGNAQPVFNLNIQGSAFSIQMSIVTIGDYNPHTVQGIVLSFSIKGLQ